MTALPTTALPMTALPTRSPDGGAVVEIHGMPTQVGARTIDAVDAAVAAIRTELLRAVALHGANASVHHHLGRIRQEYRELEDEVFGDEYPGARARQREEAAQLGAMAARFLMDVPDTA